MQNPPGQVREVIVFGDEFWEFYNRQNHKVKERLKKRFFGQLG